MGAEADVRSHGAYEVRTRKAASGRSLRIQGGEVFSEVVLLLALEGAVDYGICSGPLSGAPADGGSADGNAIVYNGEMYN